MRILKLLTAAVLALNLTACASAPSVTPSKKEVIRVTYPQSRGMGEKDLDGLREWFANNYPDAELELLSASVTTITDTVRSEFKSGSGPDMFVITDYDAFVKEGYLAKMTDMEAPYWYRKSSTGDLERFDEIYALPIGGGNLIALHYNKALFDKYELAYPTSTETFEQLVDRVKSVISENELGQSAVNVSLLYPTQVSLVYDTIFAEVTQSRSFLDRQQKPDFYDPLFTEYLNRIDTTMNKETALFASQDFENSTSSAISAFLEGRSFMYIGDVPRCYDTMVLEGYDVNDFGVTGIPCGTEGISYVAYMDDMYLGISSAYDSYSDRKKEIITQMLTYFADGRSEIRNIFTFTGPYTSVYLEGVSVQTRNEPYFDDINNCLSHNYVGQNVGGTLSTAFGRTLIAWRKNQLNKYTDSEGTNVEKAAAILDAYAYGQNPFAISEEMIGESPVLMEYQSDLVRGQETLIGNQVADMARRYMGADFALINAGGIRASIPEGNVSADTFASVLPYSNYIVNIRISGASLKKALQNAYNVGPNYHSGKFGEISGLRVVLKTKDEGYADYEAQLNQWQSEHPDADATALNEAKKEICGRVCAEDESRLNYEIVSVTDSEGNPIKDDQIYTVATMDYLLKNQDGYSILGVLSDCKDADRSIEIFDRDGKLFTGEVDSIINDITARTLTGADSFTDWVKNGGVLDATVDGRITIEHFIDVN